MILRAPAKLNLCLYLGRRRADGLHELRSLFCPLLLSDRIEVSDAEGEADEVVCPGVAGPNLVGVALEALRARGWRRAPVRVEIEKRIPVAAGLGGGSADAAAVLRLSAGEIADLPAIAAGLGADVPSQLQPSLALVGGAGELVEALPAPGEFAVVLLPDREQLATADVYAEADALGIGRSGAELDGAGDAVAGGGGRRRFAARVRGAARQRPRPGGDLAAAADRRGAGGAGRGRRRALAGRRLGADGGRPLRRPRRRRRRRLAAAAPLGGRDRLGAAAARIILV